MRDGILRSSQVHALVQLINETHELSLEAEERSRHLLSGVCRILEADAGACVLERDFRPGGRGGFLEIVLEGWNGRAAPAFEALRRMGSDSNPAIDSLRARVSAPGGIVTATRRELVEDRRWYGAPYVESFLLPSGLDDSIYSSRWSGRSGEAQGIGLYRRWGARPFDDADRELLRLFHTQWGGLFAPPPVPVRGLPDAALSPRERQTLALLLQGLGDKQIAARLGISRFTVNQYTKALYRSFGVRSRAALMARVLGLDEHGARTAPPERHALMNE